MDELVEKRVFADRGEVTELLVAASAGLVVVSLADGRVGGFGLARDCAPTDIAVDGTDRRLAVATDEDVLLADSPTVDALEPSGFGEAVAVTVHGDRIVAGAPDGRLAVYDGRHWTTIDVLPSPPTGLAGGLVGTAEGVLRLVDGSLQPAGLTAVSDVALAAGTPLAATADGLFELGNGWLDVHDGAFHLVAGAPDGRAHAATTDRLFERTDSSWAPVELPAEVSAAAVAHGPRSYVLDTAGDLLVETADGWASTPLGVDGVTAAAVY